MVTTASIRHATSAKVLIPLTDVKYEGDLKMLARPPHRKHGCCGMDFGGVCQTIVTNNVLYM